MPARKSFNLTGQSKVLANLNREIASIEGDVSRGLLLGLKHIEAGAVERAPIEYGALRGSSFADVARGRGRVRGRVGFTAKYAAALHEMPVVNKGVPRRGKGKRGTYWQGGSNKFLERALREEGPAMIRIIKRRAKR